jgi:hypothetical protein
MKSSTLPHLLRDPLPDSLAQRRPILSTGIKVPATRHFDGRDLVPPLPAKHAECGGACKVVFVSINVPEGPRVARSTRSNCAVERGRQTCSECWPGEYTHRAEEGWGGGDEERALDRTGGGRVERQVGAVRVSLGLELQKRRDHSRCGTGLGCRRDLPRRSRSPQSPRGPSRCPSLATACCPPTCRRRAR